MQLLRLHSNFRRLSSRRNSPNDAKKQRKQLLPNAHSFIEPSDQTHGKSRANIHYYALSHSKSHPVRDPRVFFNPFFAYISSFASARRSRARVKWDAISTTFCLSLSLSLAYLPRARSFPSFFRSCAECGRGSPGE